VGVLRSHLFHGEHLREDVLFFQLKLSLLLFLRRSTCVAQSLLLNLSFQFVVKLHRIFNFSSKVFLFFFRFRFETLTIWHYGKNAKTLFVCKITQRHFLTLFSKLIKSTNHNYELKKFLVSVTFAVSLHVSS